MSQQASQLEDSDFLYSHLAEYQDDDLSSDKKNRFMKVLAAEEKDLLEKYSEAKGKFQQAYQQYSLDEAQLHRLRSLVEDDVARAGHEAGNIDELGKIELRGNIIRGVLLSALILAFALGSYFYLSPPSKVSFDALGVLVYEASAMSDDLDRLDLPTSDILEVQNYFKRYPNLGFEPRLFNAIGEDWKLEGATVIDYEFIKIPVAQFTNEKLGEKLFWFQYNGEMSDLPSSEPAQYNNFSYQTYGDRTYNIIAFEMSEGVLGMMIGSRGDPDMAKMASSALIRGE